MSENTELLTAEIDPALLDMKQKRQFFERYGKPVDSKPAVSSGNRPVKDAVPVAVPVKPKTKPVPPPKKKFPITQINAAGIRKFHSFRFSTKKESTQNYQELEDEVELRNKCDISVQPILDELISSEEVFVNTLVKGIENYGNIFTRDDTPSGLRDGKSALLGNVEQLAAFHRDEFLPMLQRNRRDLKRLFDDFKAFIDQNRFYIYVIFTMQRKRSILLCAYYETYLNVIQEEMKDSLGIHSFLLQPIQRMTRYPLLLQQFLSAMFKNSVFKSLIASCCQLENKLRLLLNTINESEIFNDVVACPHFEIFSQGNFRKVDEFTVIDHTLQRIYSAKVFIFDKCIVYTEIIDKNLIFRGNYPYEHLGLKSAEKSITLFYQQRSQQECEFLAERDIIATWLGLLRETLHAFGKQEHSMLNKSTLALCFSNCTSTDSGIETLGTPQKSELECSGHSTTWYTEI